MGGESGYDDSQPAHKVKLTQGFWMLETPVTQRMWKSVMGESIQTKAHQGILVQDLYGTGDAYSAAGFPPALYGAADASSAKFPSSQEGNFVHCVSWKAVTQCSPFTDEME